MQKTTKVGRGRSHAPWSIFKNTRSENWQYKHPSGRNVNTRFADYDSAWALVQKHKREYNEEVERGEGYTVTFDKAIQIYIEQKEFRNQKVSPGTAKLLQELLPYIGDTPLRLIDQRRLNEIAKVYQAKGKGNATVNKQVYTPFISVYNAASGYHELPHRKWSKLKEKEPEQKQAATPEWTAAFINSAHELAEIDRIEGVRRAESGKDGGAKVKFKDAEVKKRLAALAACLYRFGRRLSSLLEAEIDGDYIIVAESKGWKSERLPLVASDTSKPYATRAKDLVDGMDKSFDLPLFGYKARSGSLYKMWRKICNHAGIEYIATHGSGRVAKNTRLRGMGVDDEVRNRALGWAPNSSIPNKHYLKIKDQARDAIYDL